VTLPIFLGKRASIDATNTARQQSMPATIMAG
jgi:hypothetical protein